MKLAAAYGALLCIATYLFCSHMDALASAALRLVVPAARADAERTALVLAPHSEDPALVEVTARVRGELSAAGFRVISREAPPGVGPERAVASAGADLAPSAVLWIVAASGHSEAAPALEIWLSDRLLGKVSMARLRSDTGQGDTPKVLAVEAVELLRARMSELRVHDADEAQVAEGSADAWVEQPAAASAAPRADTPAVPSEHVTKSRERPWFGVSLGFAYLLSSGSLPGAPMPTLALSLGLGEPRADALPLSCDLTLQAGGFSPHEHLQEEHGSAEVDHAFGELRAALRVVTRVPIEPFLALGFGVYTLGVRGQATAPFAGHDARYWAPTASATLGLRSRPFAHLSFVASAELLAALSRAEVHVADALAARAGGTMWLLHADLMGVF
jgi:hypothetical protein